MTADILIIEDEEDIRGFASRVLELEGYRVFQAVTVGEGLSIIRQHPVSLVLLDLRLPDCDGWAVLEKLKSDPELSKIPVVMFTASAATSQRSYAQATGVEGYLVKPLSAASLKETVDQVLTREWGDEMPTKHVAPVLFPFRACRDLLRLGNPHHTCSRVTEVYL